MILMRDEGWVGSGDVDCALRQPVGCVMWGGLGVGVSITR